ncbi:hypothetical protein [Sphingomonas sp. F9_3S_D5_B_2]
MGEPFRTSADGLAGWVQQGDSNHDGFLTSDELKQDAQRFFLTLDANHDGEIDPDELDHYETVVAPEVRVGMGGSDGLESGDDEAAGGGRLGVLSIPEPVAAADTNLDRGVSTQEFQTAAEKRFRLLDLNKDGRLTLAELDVARSGARSNARRSHRTQEPGSPPPTMPTSEVPQMPGMGRY